MSDNQLNGESSPMDNDNNSVQTGSILGGGIPKVKQVPVAAVNTGSTVNNNAQTVKKGHGWMTFILIVVALLLCGSLFFNMLLLTVCAGTRDISSSAGSFAEKTIEGKGKNKILYLPLEGVITSSPREYGNGIRDKIVVDMLKQAAEDDKIKAAIIEVNSPGGEVTASDRLNMAIRKFAEKKPLYFLMGDLCASGCVYMSTHATKIYAHPTTTTGSIGVIMHNYNLQKLMEKIGVKEVTIKSGAMKDILSSSREMTEEERAILQNLVMDNYDRFVNLVADGRHLAVEKVKAFADGRILTSSQAKDVGLIDEIAYFDGVKDTLITNLSGSEFAIVTYKRPFSLMDFGENQMMRLPNTPLGQLTDNYSFPRLMYLWQLPELD